VNFPFICGLRLIDKKRFEVATQRHVEPSQWSPSAGRVKGKSDNTIETNMALDLARTETNVLYLACSDPALWILKKWWRKVFINHKCGINFFKKVLLL